MIVDDVVHPSKWPIRSYNCRISGGFALQLQQQSDCELDMVCHMVIREFFTVMGSLELNN